MARISDIWTYETGRTLPETFKALSTLEHVYDTETGFAEINTNIDTSPFYIKATGENLFYGGIDMPRDVESPTKTPIETSDTYLGLACIYNNGYYTNALNIVSAVDYTSYLLQKQPTLASNKTPVTRSYWNNMTSFQTRQQSILAAYDYTDVKVYASIVICHKEGYNWKTVSTSIKDCANYVNDTTAKIVGISIQAINYKDMTNKLPDRATIVANITYDDMSLQTPIGNLTDETDKELQYISWAIFDRLMINPIYLDLEADIIDGYYIPFKCSLDDTDTMCKMLASIGYIIECPVDNTHTTIYPIITSGMCDGSYTLDKDVFDESDNGKWHDTDTINPPKPIIPDKDDITEMKSNDVMSIYGLVKYYKMTSTELAGMISEIEDLDDDKAMSCFVSCYHVPMLSEQIAVFSPNINIRIAGHTLSQTADRIVSNQRHTLATFNVPVRHGNAFDTLTKYYLYTPFTDVIPLDYKCYGRTITVELHPSIQDITAVLTVKCEGMIIHKQSVSLGSALAISVENNAEKQQALISACAKYGASAMGTLGGFMTGNIPAIAGGTLGVIASTTNVLNAIDRNYIHSYGTNTGASIGLLPSQVYFIENYVSLDKPTNFATIQGNLVNKEMTLTSGMGFTKLDKPRIDCSLTAPEINELMQLLENGVIL